MRRFIVHLCWFSLVLGVSGLSGGCTLEDVVDEAPDDPPPADNTPPPSSPDRPPSGNLPTNPSIPPNPSGTSRQLWYFGYKSYDNTFRIRWPTHLHTQYGIGPGSYTMIDGQRARFRSFDTDYGAKRPSYTIPGPKSRFSGEVICILYTANGTPLAWFKTNADATRQGRLP